MAGEAEPVTGRGRGGNERRGKRWKATVYKVEGFEEGVEGGRALWQGERAVVWRTRKWEGWRQLKARRIEESSTLAQGGQAAGGGGGAVVF